MIDLNPAWRFAREAIIFKRRGSPLMVRMPYAPDNRAWLGSIRTRVRGLVWNRAEGHWECPSAWLSALAEVVVARCGRVWLVQEIDGDAGCNESCMNARGLDCECGCLGRNHGAGAGDGWARRVEVSDTCTLLGGVYAGRLLGPKGAGMFTSLVEAA